MYNFIDIARDYNITSAAVCAAAAMVLYLPIRVIFLKICRMPRKSLLEEAALTLLVGYFAALVNIVWLPIPEFIRILLNDPSGLKVFFQDGYYAHNYEIFRCLFAEGSVLALVEDFEMLANVALFVPLGFLLPFSFKGLKWWQTDLICAGTTCFVELVQPLFGRAGDLDDVITNALGGIIGCALAKLMIAIFVRKRSVTYEK